MSVTQFFWFAILFALIFGTGFWLRGAKRPLPVGKLTLHKLLSLACLALLGLAVSFVARQSALSASQLAAAIACGVLFAATIASGGLVSLERPPSRSVRALHWAGPFLTLVSAAWLLFQLL